MSLIYLLIFFFIAVELLLFSLIKVHRKSFPWLIVKKDKFPVSLKLFNNSISLPSAYDVKKYDILKIYKYLSKFKNTLMIQKKYL